MMKMGRRKETRNGMQGVAVCLNLRCAMRVTTDVGAFVETDGGTEECVVLRS